MNVATALACILLVVALLGGPAAGQGIARPAKPPPAGNRSLLVLVPAFDGPGALGLNVSTLLTFQVFTTLRKAPTPNPDRLSFGDATIFWDTKPLPVFSHAGAEAAAQADRSLPKDVVLWGKVSPYAEGVVFQSFLTLARPDPSRPPRHGSWRLRIGFTSEPIVLTADIPERHYAFEPLVIDAAIVNRYSSPGALKIYRDKTMRVEVGAAAGFVRAEAIESGGAWLAQPKGWLPLPVLSRTRSEVTDFTGAMIRMLRGDWLGAEQLFTRVLAHPTTPAGIRGAAWLFIGLAKEKYSRSGRAEFEQAFKLNSLSQQAAVYLIMSAFGDYGRPSAAADSRASDFASVLGRLRALLDETRFLFDDNDAWFAAAMKAYQRLASGERPLGVDFLAD